MSYTYEQIKELGYHIDGGLRVNGYYYFIDYVNEEDEIIYAFEIDNGCKIDTEFTYTDLADKENIELFCLKEIEV